MAYLRVSLLFDGSSIAHSYTSILIRTNPPFLIRAYPLLSIAWFHFVWYSNSRVLRAIWNLGLGQNSFSDIAISN
jgi:hypothetical protein